MDIRPFNIVISDEEIGDLRERLARTRWPDEVANAGWNYGVPLATMQSIAEWWRSGFDWRKHELRINSFPNYKASLGGRDVHFIHVRGQAPNAVPLLLTHGWPSSFYEMLDLIPLLTLPVAGDEDQLTFDVVVPSVPGYGFSDRPDVPGFHYGLISERWCDLMSGLGYEQFGAHSYDIGASIMSHILLQRPERLIGYHTTEATNPGPLPGPDSAPLTKAEAAFLEEGKAWEQREGGYMAQQTTRPQTLGYGVHDSPVGTAAWILEKWCSWTADEPEVALDRIGRENLVANISIYWFTGTLNAANRLYYERARNPPERTPDQRIGVPLGVARTTRPDERAPREYVERTFADIRHWIDLPRGGHFVAIEEPRLVANSIREFFRLLR